MIKLKIPLLLTFFISFNLYAQQKHALIIAIGDYPEAGGWPKISSAADVPFIQNSLIKWNFNEKNIKIILNENATKKGIRQALDSFTARLNPGDIAFIHISSHGEQIEDNNGDENDKLDESIVCYEAVAPSRSQNYFNDTGGYFRDDDFGSYLIKIRSKLGQAGDLAVFMDACHSGTGTRGIASFRGGAPPLVSPGFKFSSNPIIDTAGVFHEKTTPKISDLCPYVIFSAARAEEFAFEVTNENNQKMGSLSYALSQTLSSPDSGITYQALFSNIQGIINFKIKGQHPVLEGTAKNRKIFGGTFTRQEKYCTIRKILNSETIEINAGIFTGYSKNAIVGFYPAGTLNPFKAVAIDTGIIIQAGSYQSTVKTNQKMVKNSSAWVFLLEPVYNMEPVVLQFKEFAKSVHKKRNFNATEINNCKKILSESRLISYEGTPELWMVKGSAQDSLFMCSSGNLFTTISNDSTYPENLKSAIQQYAQYKYLLGLKINDAQLNTEVELIPVRNALPDTSLSIKYYKNGTFVCKEGSQFMLKVKNKSSRVVYVNILDIQPDGWINPVLPISSKNIFPGNCKIPAHGEVIYSDYILEIAPPYGIETFKIFTSTSEIDLETLATADLKGARGVFDNIMNELVFNARQANTRGATTIKLGGSNGSVQNLLFEIIP